MYDFILFLCSINLIAFRCELYIHPHSRFKKIWDIFTGLLALYYPIFQPLRMAFDLEYDNYIIIDIILNSIFLIDIIFICITGIIDEGGN